MKTRDLMIILFLSMAVLFLCQTGLASPLFNAKFDLEAGDWPYSVAIGDLDGDSDLDLAVANLGSNNVSVLLGNGDGTFQGALNSGAGDGPYSVAIGDLDGDNDLDLAVVNAGSGNVSVLLGNGDGTFQDAVNYGVGFEPRSVAIGDLDGDNDLDLAVANWWSNNVSVLLGNGNGTFDSAVHYGAGEGPYSVAIGDLDGDSDLDLAVANEYSGNVSVLLGNGNGTFQDAVNYGAGEGPYSVAIGDLDGNGSLDLAVANFGSDNVSVLINSLCTVESVYPKGWSMISLSVDPTDKRHNKLFPDAVVAYGYEQGTGYVRVKSDEDLEVGRGYWVLLDEEKTYTLTGHPITSYTYPVSSDGWAMIGGCYSSAQVSSNHCNTGVIYRYVQGAGYQQVTANLEPGEGYWILLRDVTEQAEMRVEAMTQGRK